jgi:hypothetical protein
VALIACSSVAVLGLSPLATEPLLPLSVVWLALTCATGAVAFGATAGVAALDCARPLRRVLGTLRWLAAGMILTLTGWAFLSTGPLLLCAEVAIVWDAVRQDARCGERLPPRLVAAAGGAAVAVLVLALAARALPAR